jgi:hypothetical protein
MITLNAIIAVASFAVPLAAPGFVAAQAAIWSSTTVGLNAFVNAPILCGNVMYGLQHSGQAKYVSLSDMMCRVQRAAVVRLVFLS